MHGNGTKSVTAILAALCAALPTGCGSSGAQPAASVAPPSASGRATGTTTNDTDAATRTSTVDTDRATAGAPPGAPQESDPAVQALRRHYEALARAVNTQKTDGKALTDSSTVSRQEFLPGIVQSEKGLRYPGPIPFAPVSRRTVTSARQELVLCVMGGGFAIDPGTGRPREPESVTRVLATVIRQNGEWKVDSVFDETGSCDTVQVTRRRF